MIVRKSFTRDVAIILLNRHSGWIIAIRYFPDHVSPFCPRADLYMRMRR